MSKPLLQVDELDVAIGTAEIVRAVSFAVEPGELSASSASPGRARR